MRDIGLYFGGWGGVSVYEDLLDEMMCDDFGVESESIVGVERFNFFFNVVEDCFFFLESDVVIIVEDGVVFVLVGLLRWFGNFFCLEEDFEL